MKNSLIGLLAALVAVNSNAMDTATDGTVVLTRDEAKLLDTQISDMNELIRRQIDLIQQLKRELVNSKDKSCT